MTATTIIILVLAYGVGAAICVMVGVIIGAASTRPRQKELHEMDLDQPPARTQIWNGRDF